MGDCVKSRGFSSRRTNCQIFISNSLIFSKMHNLIAKVREHDLLIAAWNSVHFTKWAKFVRKSAKLRPSHADGQLVRLYRNFDPRLLTKSVTVACKALIIDWAFCQRVASRMFWRLWCQSQALFCLRQIRAWTSIFPFNKTNDDGKNFPL